MKFKVLTLFPEMIRRGLSESIIGRAAEKRLIELETVNIRDYTLDRHGKVDDYTYGGGAGMLMQAQPVYDAWRAVTSEDKRPRTIYVTPQGKLFTQAYAEELAGEEELVFLCGHYEGIDQRVLDEIVTDYISIGDYVLTGGELPAMVMIDAVSRLVPGVLHNEESAETESFHRHLLEYPQYSRPEEWMGKKVPEVLLSGDHRRITEWRRKRSEKLTCERRPDLFAKYTEQEEMIERLTRNKRLCIHMMESLRRGRGSILFRDEESVLIYDRTCKLGMFHRFAPNPVNAVSTSQPGYDCFEEFINKAQSVIPPDMELAVTTDEGWNEILCRLFPLEVVSECLQACYTQRNPLHVRHKDIRPVTEAQMDYVAEYYDRDGREYLRERMEAGALYGAFAEDQIIGFAGWHSDGSIGLLYVDEAHRHKKIGTSLEAFCINRQLEMGYVPYGHIVNGNEISVDMQKRMGLIISDTSLWWLERKECC